MLRRSVVLALVLLLVPLSSGAAPPTDRWSWPLDDHRLGETFRPPASDYGPGHRGIDVSAAVGDAVHAVAAGTVTFAGQVGGVPVVTVDHGRERSTYQPVEARVRVGDAVMAHDVIGTLLGAPSHCAGACLHLGRLIGRDYLDPLELLAGARFRLIDPDGSPPQPPPGSTGELQRPVGGPITSAFGMRAHPVTGVRKLHDGTDFGVPCGTPVHAAAGGVVIGRSTDPAYGRRIEIEHGPGLMTSYNHLSEQAVTVGQRVAAGQVIGASGTTGLSTGCHLHFMVVVDGAAVNPADRL